MGIGLGGFEAYFPSQRPASIGSAGIFDRGHSTPLEIAVELGLPVTVLLGALVLVFLTMLAVTAMRTRRRDVIASLCVALLGLLHSCVDFSLQIPGYAVTYAALDGDRSGPCGGNPSPGAGPFRGSNVKKMSDVLTVVAVA